MGDGFSDAESHWKAVLKEFLEEEIKIREGEFNDPSHRLTYQPIPGNFLSVLGFPRVLITRLTAIFSGAENASLIDLLFVAFYARQFDLIHRLQSLSEFQDKVLVFVDVCGHAKLEHTFHQHPEWQFVEGDADILAGLAKKHGSADVVKPYQPFLVVGLPDDDGKRFFLWSVHSMPES
jgi:hypothetical protein